MAMIPGNYLILLKKGKTFNMKGSEETLFLACDLNGIVLNTKVATLINSLNRKIAKVPTEDIDSISMNGKTIYPLSEFNVLDLEKMVEELKEEKKTLELEKIVLNKKIESLNTTILLDCNYKRRKDDDD